MLQDGLLRGRRILITGGGTGLGLAMADRFAALGAQLVLSGRRAEVLAAARDGLVARHGASVQTLTCDVRDAAAVEAMFDAAWQQGPLDVLVNNAAATFIAQTERLSARAADAILGPTLHGALYCTLQAGRRWIDGGRPGVVLSILSTSTRTGRAFTVPSAMAKSGLLAMTRSLAVEWGPHGIRSVAIAPGPFPTAGAGQALDPTAGRAFANVAPSAGAAAPYPANPLGRVGRPPELAELAAFLVSDSAAYINGEMIAIDGGQHLRTSGAEDLLGWGPDDWARARAGRGG
ncbi:NAD(P)-dependent dehydrogenase (short-subunit alcohol dehydrogenase family) [Pseudacidovorax intermedius]|uniref:Peroxisomal trans-2-enoyl-CoA reductase n=2 Tax=Pseudacidovorax intermedius TaxID=433924 RepID=A0A370F7J2_9BURK|nr:SDR family oxidoreductase [Pseudacidovorax intermedius]RDI17716.1 NAD(P)-dependent dehydrogenase (short-subunit alcohol dehydrogenase family) [Pseudacidovorax intermedius]